VLSKIQPTGPFVDEWKKGLAVLSDVEQVDVSLGLSSAAMAVKDENELVGSLLQSSYPGC